jgi:hypothetical protein
VDAVLDLGVGGVLADAADGPAQEFGAAAGDACGDERVDRGRNSIHAMTDSPSLSCLSPAEEDPGRGLPRFDPGSSPWASTWTRSMATSGKAALIRSSV